MFTYGALMFQPLWERVVRGRYASMAATLADHARRAVRDDAYPGMVAKPGQSVRGVAHVDVGDEDIAALDVVQGSDTRRIVVAVTLEDGEAVQAHTCLRLDN